MTERELFCLMSLILGLLCGFWLGRRIGRS